MGASFSKHSSWHPGLNAYVILGAIRILLVGRAYFLAMNSKRNGTRLSPVGLASGFKIIGKNKDFANGTGEDTEEYILLLDLDQANE